MNSTKKISILGYGWLGRPLGKHLSSLGFQIKGSVKSIEKLKSIKDDKPLIFQVDINDLNSKNDLDFFDSEILIFAIPPSKIEDIESTFEKLRSIIESSKVESIILISSTGIYKNLNKNMIEDSTEEELHLDRNLYKIERFFKELKNVKLNVLRLAGLIGPDRHPLIFMNRGKTISNPDSPVNYINLQDILEIIQILIERNLWGHTLNCCMDEHPNKSDLYKEIAIANNQKAPSFSLQTDSFKTIDNSKLKELLDFNFGKLDMKPH